MIFMQAAIIAETQHRGKICIIFFFQLFFAYTEPTKNVTNKQFDSIRFTLPPNVLTPRPPASRDL